MDFREPRALGKTGPRVSRLGFGSSYGAPASAYEMAFHEHGVNFFYWGSMRRAGMGEAVRRLAREGRERIVVALQSYDRSGFLMGTFVDRGLRALGLDYADLLILGWHNAAPPPRVLCAARRLIDSGRVRWVAVSGHNRRLFGSLAGEPPPPVSVFMFRYNAAHRGAEEDIFPHLQARDRPGTIAYTATRWGQLLDPKRMPPGEQPITATDCYRFVLTRPEVDLCLSGPASEDQVREALRALEAGPLGPQEMERARRIGDHVARRGAGGGS